MPYVNIKITREGATCGVTDLLMHVLDKRPATAAPGVGPVLATALVAAVADPKSFRSGRNFSAWIGIRARRDRNAAPATIELKRAGASLILMTPSSVATGMRMCRSRESSRHRDRFENAGHESFVAAAGEVIRPTEKDCTCIGVENQPPSVLSSQLGHFESVQGRPCTSGSGPGYCRLFMNREARRRLKWFGGIGSSFKILQTFSFPVATTVPGRKDIHHPNGVIHRDSARFVYGCGGSRCWFDYSYDRSRW